MSELYRKAEEIFEETKIMETKLSELGSFGGKIVNLIKNKINEGKFKKANIINADPFLGDALEILTDYA